MTEEKNNFNPWKIIIFVTIALLTISILSNWYAQQVTLPRYCDNPEQTLHLLQKILTEERPAGEEARRSYIIAAKLLFLVPRKSEETLPDYLDRVRQNLLQTKCVYVDR